MNASPPQPVSKGQAELSAVDDVRYVIITPCRNEAEFAHRTLDSVLRQSVLPTKWVIVDDGSTDGTSGILDEYAHRCEFIEIVRLGDRGRRSVGPGVMEAFAAGLETVDLDDYEFLCKLDLDLELPREYFEGLIRRMRADPRIASCSGKAYYLDSTGHLVRESIADDVSVGASKFYRVKAFRQIGGFVRAVMWDGIDVHRSRMSGWRVRSWDDEDIRFLHLRPMGSSYRGIWSGRARHGEGQYFMGTGPVFILASAVHRMARPPYFIGGLAILWGYFRGMIRRMPRYEDREFRRFLRRYHRSCLIFGKRRAVSTFEAASGAAPGKGESGATTPLRRQP